jgi:hypothetical protein
MARMAAREEGDGFLPEKTGFRAFKNFNICRKLWKLHRAQVGVSCVVTA